MRVRFGAFALATMLAAYGAASYAAEPAKGEALAEAQCADCHEPADWEGESAESLTTMTKDIVAGKTKHKTKLKLTDEEIAAIAAFWATAK